MKYVPAFLLLAVALGCTVKPQTYTGVVTTQMCNAGHHAAGITAAECVGLCRKEGSPYVLVVSGKAYKLDGEIGGLDPYAGATASVYGPRRGSTIHVTSVSAPKD